MVRILVVDDDQVTRILLLAMLENEGCSVDTAADGRQALEIIEKTRPNLVITDLVMPQMEGMEMIITIQSIAPDIPVIAMSGDQGYLGPCNVSARRRPCQSRWFAMNWSPHCST